MKKISVIFGTRPEAIKLAPVILELKKYPESFDCKVCVTAQHRQMLDQVLEIFEIEPDVDLNLMVKDQTLTEFTAKAISAIDKYLKDEKPDMVIVQGDTTTVFCAALTAFYNKIPVAHVEAGLRTGNIYAPWPEEINRVLTSKLTTIHFSPTKQSRINLIKEGINLTDTHITGNTVIDALLIAIEKVKNNPPEIPDLPDNNLDSFNGNQIVLITGHRRENFGIGFDSICNAIAKLAEKFPEVHFIYPVHLNPNVQDPVNRILNNKKYNNIHLIKPLAYLPFVALMNRADIILTDSGGVQEEAPSLGKPVLVMREVTERPEGLLSGTIKLVGTDEEKIITETSKLIMNVKNSNDIPNKYNPYGDGKASDRIVKILLEHYHFDN